MNIVDESDGVQAGLSIGLEVVVPLQCLTARDVGEIVLRACRDSPRQQGGELQVYGAPVGRSTWKELANRWSAEFSLGGVQVHYASLPRFKLGFFQVAGLLDLEAEAWLDGTMAHVVPVTCRCFDREYEFWQNAQDLGVFAAAGRSIAGLPLRQNGLPPPLAASVVDTSANPGRRVLRTGYIEAVGHRMWVQPGCVAWRTNSPGMAVLAGLGVAWEEGATMDHILADSKPFQDVGTKDVQNALRTALFTA